LPIVSVTGSPDRVSALSSPGTRPGIRPVIRHGQRRASHTSRFPAAFRPPAFASRSPCSRPGTGPSSRSAYRAPPGARTRTGFPRFTPARYDRGGCPLYPGDGGAPPGRMPCPAGACRFPAASPCTPQPHPTSGAPQLRGINGGSRDSPVRSAPHLWPPGWDGRPLGLSLCSAPRRYRRRTTGRGRAASTRPELRDRHSRSSNPRVHSHSATSCRNGRCGCGCGAALADGG
jgi:hypothetical protein